MSRGRTPDGTIELLERLRPDIPWKEWRRGCSVRLVIETAVAARDKAERGRHSVCGICGEKADGTGYDFDHIVPLVLGGSHHIDNIQFTHSRCNRRKGGRSDG